LTVPRFASPYFDLKEEGAVFILRLRSEDGTNRLTRACVLALTDAIEQLAKEPRPLIISGNDRFFSAGAELAEIAELGGLSAYQFARMGQQLMRLVSDFPAPACAAISGYCMGGGLDLALACRHRIATPGAVFGHRGAALGLITGWGGTQRLPRLLGKGMALQMFIAAEKITAGRALETGLIDTIAEDPLAQALLAVKERKAFHRKTKALQD
jgi:enoyl-CoA hydratase/carnithine racemase